jgi:hypothetical protein
MFREEDSDVDNDAGFDGIKVEFMKRKLSVWTCLLCKFVCNT